MNDPFTVERHPASYPWRKRFPDAGMLLGLEGGVVYAAEAEGALWIITDEGTMSEFLSKEDHDLLAILVTLERYTSATAWARAVLGWLGLRERAYGDGRPSDAAR